MCLPPKQLFHSTHLQSRGYSYNSICCPICVSHVCMYVCMYGWMDVCMYVYIYVRTCRYVVPQSLCPILCLETIKDCVVFCFFFYIYTSDNRVCLKMGYPQIEWFIIIMAIWRYTLQTNTYTIDIYIYTIGTPSSHPF